MLAKSRCWTRKCKHYLRVIQPDGTEMTEINNCFAFLEGIPAEITYDSNLHLKPLPDQDNDIVFEKE